MSRTFRSNNKLKSISIWPKSHSILLPCKVGIGILLDGHSQIGCGSTFLSIFYSSESYTKSTRIWAYVNRYVKNILAKELYSITFRQPKNSGSGWWHTVVVEIWINNYTYQLYGGPTSFTIVTSRVSKTA